MTDGGRDGRRSPPRQLTVDIVVFTRQGHALAVLAIERAKDPFAGALALPGGFVEPGERAVDAAIRELSEETGLAISRSRLRRLGLYQAPGRDPRGRIASAAYHGFLPGAPAVAGGSDARLARWVDIRRFLAPRQQIAFDHRDIVVDAVSRRLS